MSMHLCRQFAVICLHPLMNRSRPRRGRAPSLRTLVTNQPKLNIIIWNYAELIDETIVLIFEVV